jgi:Helix-turn-helix domain
MKNFAAPRGLGRESVGMIVVSTVPDFFTVEEAAAILRIGRTAAYALAREYLATNGVSGLPVVRLGKLLRVPRTKLEALIGGPITWPLKAAPTAAPTIGTARPRAGRARASVVEAPMLPFSR